MSLLMRCQNATFFVVYTSQHLGGCSATGLTTFDVGSASSSNYITGSGSQLIGPVIHWSSCPGGETAQRLWRSPLVSPLEPSGWQWLGNVVRRLWCQIPWWCHLYAVWQVTARRQQVCHGQNCVGFKRPTAVSSTRTLSSRGWVLTMFCFVCVFGQAHVAHWRRSGKIA